MKVFIATALALLGIGITTIANRAAAASAVRSETLCVDVYPIGVLGQPITTDTYEVCVPAP